MNYQLQSQPRHMRYIFFVDAAIPYSELMEIMKDNLNYWGGAYNPIVPVKDGKIADGYPELIRHFDPDKIYHATTLDPQIIKDLGWFNPSEYVNLGVMPLRATIDGVSRLHLLSLVDKQPLIYANNIWRTESVLLDYYELNFGIRPVTYVGEDRARSGHKVLPITPESFSDLHADIYKHKPINYAELASLYPCTKVLRSFQHVQFNSTELVITADAGDNRDLFYWWNRNLYKGGKAFIVTRQQLSELVTDEYFGPVLCSYSDMPHINVVSFSMLQQEVEDIINTALKPLRSGRLFKYTQIASFPYPIDAVRDAKDYIDRDPGKQQSLFAGETKFAVAVPAFVTGGLSATDTWAVDMQITSIGDDTNVKEILLPKTTNVAYFLRKAGGRVNLNRRLTYYYGSNTPHIPATVELIKIPTFSTILPQIVQAPVVDGVVCRTSYTHTEVGDPGRRLLSFFRLSAGDLTVLQHYLSDKFWYELLIQCCESEKIAGAALSLKLLTGKCLRFMVKEGYEIENEGQRHKKLKSLQLSLKPYIGQLVDMKVLLPGYTLNCTRCGQPAWYGLESVAVTVKCSGCQDYFALPVDPPISYRLSTLVQRNFYENFKKVDGNAVVIRTLLKLARQTPMPFDFSGQLDLYGGHPNQRKMDIDIVVNDNGEFVIGEAKNDASQFFKNNNESLCQLYEVGSQICPDRIILSCAQDSKNKLNEARDILDKLFTNQKVRPTIDAILIIAPTFSIFRVPGRRSSES